jgi:phosphatidylglycerol:prolipoprotein diacylglycerol transferase
LQKYKRFHGQVVLAYVLGYAMVRFTVEFFRGDRIRGVYEVVGGVALSTSQIVALLMFIGALGFGAYRLKQLGALPKVPTAP